MSRYMVYGSKDFKVSVNHYFMFYLFYDFER